MTRGKLTLIAIMLLGYSTLAISQDISFTDTANLPEARSGTASANNGENIYVANGFSVTEGFTGEIFQYDVSMDSWSTLTSSSIPKRYASAAVVGDFLYVFNGSTESGTLNSSVEKIDLADGSIQNLSENPLPARVAGVAQWDDKIYSFGGNTAPGVYSNKVYKFDPQVDTWTEITEMPFAGETKGTVVDGKLYVVGGFNGAVSNTIYVYNLSTGMWEPSVEMPIGASAHAITAIGSKIYIVGDFTNLKLLASFDTADDSFQVLGNNLNSRRHCAAEAVGGSLFAIGGNTTSSIQSSIANVQRADILTSVRGFANAELIAVHPNPTSRFLRLNGMFEAVKIYDIAGREVSSFTNVTEVEVTSLADGTYFLRGNSGGKLYQAKFVKQ